MDEPNILNPFQALNIANGTSRPDVVKPAFRRMICSPDRRQRATAALAYDMLSTNDSEKYMKLGNTYCVSKKDIFYYVNIGNYELFVEQIRKQKSLLNRRDERGRTLLYIAARNGFHNICSFLLKSGCNINEIQNDESTALHAASYYGHQPVVELLLEYGANSERKNRYGHTPRDEAATAQIQRCILSKTEDMINIVLNCLKSDGTAKNMVIIKHFGRVIAKKILRNSDCFSDYSLSDLTRNWTLAWHGTKYQHLGSIMKHGLQAAGTVLSPGHQISIQAGHIALNKRVGTIDNWAQAVFISPSIFYAAD